MKQTTETAEKDKGRSLSVSGQPVGAGHTLRRLLWAPLALALAVGFGTNSTAGTSSEAATINPVASMKGIDGPEDSVYAVAEEMPVYPGGGQAVLADIAANCRYPVEEKKPKNGTVMVRFVIDTVGRVKDAIIFQGMGQPYDSLAVNAVKRLKRFKPGRVDGKPVHVWFTIPIRFAFDPGPERRR